MNLLSPRSVMQRVAAALPEDCRDSAIIIGSLAAGFHFFGDDSSPAMTTKDVDCMLSPHVKAVRNGKAVAERLFSENWRLRPDAKWGKPGDASTPTEELPIVRLHPPETSDWFIELLASPPTGTTKVKAYERLATASGHFTLCSFRFLALAEEDPIRTEFGIYIARPEMMALANLLHHPKIGAETIEGTSWKRVNKDVGRVLALAWLATARNEDALLGWHGRWLAALKRRFPKEWRKLGSRAGDGLRALLASASDLDQATLICNLGLLARLNVSARNLETTGKRLLQDAIEPLKAAARHRTTQWVSARSKS